MVKRQLVCFLTTLADVFSVLQLNVHTSQSSLDVRSAEMKEFLNKLKSAGCSGAKTLTCLLYVLYLVRTVHAAESLII